MPPPLLPPDGVGEGGGGDETGIGGGDDTGTGGGGGGEDIGSGDGGGEAIANGGGGKDKSFDPHVPKRQAPVVRLYIEAKLDAPVLYVSYPKLS